MRVGWLVLAAVGCGPVVALPGDDDGSTGRPPTPDTSGGSTSGNVPPSVTVGTAPMPITTGVSTVDPSDADTTTGGPWHPDWGSPPISTGECLPWATQGCADLNEPNAYAVGSTPLGDFAINYAVFSADAFCGGCVEGSNIERVYLLSDPMWLPEYGDPDEGIVLDLYDFEGPENVEFEATITAFRNGESTSTTVAVEIDGIPAAYELAEPFEPNDPAITPGSFGTPEPGWSMYGDFSAFYCPRLNGYAICE